MAAPDPTHPPSPEKLRRLRHLGDVPQSDLLVSGAAVCAALLALALRIDLLTSYADWASRTWSLRSPSPQAALHEAAMAAGPMLGVALAAAFFAAFAAAFLQVGPLFSLAALSGRGRGSTRRKAETPSALERVSPSAAGFGWLVAALFVCIQLGPVLGRVGPVGVLPACLVVLMLGLAFGAAFSFASGALDAALRRLAYRLRHRMSQPELAAEQRRQFGTPLARRRRARRYREEAIAPHSARPSLPPGASAVVRGPDTSVVVGERSQSPLAVYRGAASFESVRLARRAGLPVIDDPGLLSHLRRGTSRRRAAGGKPRAASEPDS